MPRVSHLEYSTDVFLTPDAKFLMIDARIGGWIVGYDYDREMEIPGDLAPAAKASKAMVPLIEDSRFWAQ